MEILSAKDAAASYWCPHIQVNGDYTNRGKQLKYETFRCIPSGCPKWEWVGEDKTSGFCNFFGR